MRTARVYVVSDDNGWVKIGLSSDPSARVRTLQTGNPRSLRISYATHTMQRRKAEAIERLAHSFLAKGKGVGEWFSCHPDLAALIVSAADIMPKDMQSYIEQRQ